MPDQSNWKKEVQPIHYYTTTAMEKWDIPTVRQLSLKLGGNPAMVHYWLSGKSLPSEKQMMNLSRLCEIPPEVALMDLAYWRQFDNPLADHYRRLRNMAVKAAAACVAVTLIGFAAISPSETIAEQAEAPVKSMYIMLNY